MKQKLLKTFQELNNFRIKFTHILSLFKRCMVMPLGILSIVWYSIVQMVMIYPLIHKIIQIWPVFIMLPKGMKKVKMQLVCEEIKLMKKKFKFNLLIKMR